MNERICPTCSLVIQYSTVSARNKAERKKSSCIGCVNRIKSIKYSGEKNPFFNKEHTKEFKDRLSRERKGKHFSPETEFKKGEKKIRVVSLKESLAKKYGEDTERYKKEVLQNSMRISNSLKGEKNPMYGRPSPVGSGNGWSGWYKGWYFRSLLELSYMINVIERFNLKWESGESQKYKLPYVTWDGKVKNYFTDFIIEGKYAIECKPRSLWKSNTVIRKKEAAIEHFKSLGMIYKIRECKKISDCEIRDLVESGSLKFAERYEKKYSKYSNNGKG